MEQAHHKLPNLNEKSADHQPSNKLKLDLEQSQEEPHVPSAFTAGPPQASNLKIEDQANPPPPTEQVEEKPRENSSAKTGPGQGGGTLESGPDLNIFEQFNFDEMNINFEDINQSKQQQEVINSSDSDIDPQRQEAPNHENE